jgi:hypothetical protein
MIVHPSHPDAARYRALKGTSLLGKLVRLDTKTREFEQVVAVTEDGHETVTGVADRIFYRAPGATNWEEING